MVFNLLTQSAHRPIHPGEKARDLVNLKNRFVAEASLPQLINVRLLHRRGGARELRHIIQHRVVGFGEGRLAVIAFNRFDPLQIVDVPEETLPMVSYSMLACVKRRNRDGDHLTLRQCQVAIAIHEIVVEAVYDANGSRLAGFLNPHFFVLQRDIAPTERQIASLALAMTPYLQGR